jgi:hypothetical protein
VSVQSRIKEHKRVALDLLDPFAFGNPRRMEDQMRATLAHSLSEFGIVEPIVVRPKPDAPGRFEILNGHHRYDALKSMNEQDADVVVVDLPDDQKARALVLALNRISADWDKEQLDSYVNAILSDGATPEWLTGVTGFTAQELDQLSKVGTDFLNDMAVDGSTAVVESELGDLGSVDKLTFSLVLTKDQHVLVHKALKQAKTLGGLGGSPDALVEVCRRYLGES